MPENRYSYSLLPTPYSLFHIPPVLQKRPPVEKPFTFSTSFAILFSHTGGNAMKVRIRIDPACEAPEIVVRTARVTPELEALVRSLEGGGEQLTAYTERGAVFLPLEAVIRVYAQRQAVLAQTAEGTFTLRQRLYELEEKLAPHRFVRISNSEIVNARMITGMDFSLTGTIRMSLRGGVETYASRRYVSKIKKQFDV